MRRAHPPHSGQHLNALGRAFSTKYREPARRAGLRELRGLSGASRDGTSAMVRAPGAGDELTGVRL